MNNRKRFIGYLLLFLFSFIISFIVYVVFFSNCDEIWNYGFCYNISKGMIIYRDFNVLPTPLYFFCGSLFIKLFGNYIISLHILDAIICGLIFIMLFKIIRWKSFVIFPVLMICFPLGYNLMSLLWLFIILLMIYKKCYNDFILGIIVGLSFITKQNIGICLFIPYIFYSKNKFKSIIYFIIPFSILSIYLIYNNAFYNFIDYCFLGLFDFGGKNSIFTIFTFLEIILLIYLLYVLVRSKFRDREVFYILMFQIMVYPIFNFFHFIMGIIPILYWFLKDKNNKYINIILIVLAWSIYFLIVYSIYSCCNIEMRKNMLYLRNYNSSEIETLYNVYDYIKDYDYYFFTSEYGYYIKLYFGADIDEFDLVISGNLGYKGVFGKFNEINSLCKNNTCVFIVNDGVLGSQFEEFYNYIINSYEKIDTLEDFDVYSNG